MVSLDWQWTDLMPGDILEINLEFIEKNLDASWIYAFRTGKKLTIKKIWIDILCEEINLTFINYGNVISFPVDNIDQFNRVPIFKIVELKED